MELTEPGLRVKNAEKMQQSKRASGEEMRPAVSVIMPVYNGEKYICLLYTSYEKESPPSPADSSLPHYFPASAVQYKPGICRCKGKSEKHQN